MVAAGDFGWDAGGGDWEGVEDYFLELGFVLFG